MRRRAGVAPRPRRRLRSAARGSARGGGSSAETVIPRGPVGQAFSCDCAEDTELQHFPGAGSGASRKGKRLDLGIAGRKAIVCASSRGLGRGCAMALAENGVELVLNGRDASSLDLTASDIADRFGVAVTPVIGDVSDPAVQAELLSACPEPDILVNNNGGPPRRGFRELDRDRIVAGVVQNMVTPIELITAVIDGMAARGFG